MHVCPGLTVEKSVTAFAAGRCGLWLRLISGIG